LVLVLETLLFLATDFLALFYGVLVLVLETLLFLATDFLTLFYGVFVLARVSFFVDFDLFFPIFIFLTALLIFETTDFFGVDFLRLTDLDLDLDLDFFTSFALVAFDFFFV